MTTKTKIKKLEIKNKQAKSYNFNGKKFVVCNVDDEYFAVEDICSHDEAELVNGECDLVENCQIQCPRHGARFDVRSGAAVRMPAVVGIRTYSVKVIGDELEIEIDE